jgi:hypothetical protein
MPPKGILSEFLLLPVATTSPSWLLQSCLRSITAARRSANAPSLAAATTAPPLTNFSSPCVFCFLLR